MLKSYYFLIPFLALTACHQPTQTSKAVSQQDSLNISLKTSKPPSQQDSLNISLNGTPANVPELIIFRGRPDFNNPLPTSLASFIPRQYSPTDKDWLLTRKITESYFMDKRHYESDTLAGKDLGKILFIKEYCKHKKG